jgi:hypothetical protein
MPAALEPSCPCPPLIGCWLTGGERTAQGGCTRARIPETPRIGPERSAERARSLDVPGMMET